MKKTTSLLLVFSIPMLLLSCRNNPSSLQKTGSWTFHYSQNIDSSNIINDKCSYLCGNTVSCNFTKANQGEIWFSSPDTSCKSVIKYTYNTTTGMLNITEIISGKSYSSTVMNDNDCYDVFIGNYKWEQREKSVGFRFYSLANPNLSLFCDSLKNSDI